MSVNLYDKNTKTLIKAAGNTRRVTSWEETPDDDKVPSEKLVKDTIDDVTSYNHISRNIFDFKRWLITTGLAVNSTDGVNKGKITAIGDGSITLTATGDDSYTVYSGDDFYKIPAKPNTTYTLSLESDNDSSIAGNIFFFDADHYNNAATFSIQGTKKSVSLTTMSDSAGLAMRIGIAKSGNTVTFSNIQIEEGSEATEYTPYSKNTVELTKKVDDMDASLKMLGYTLPDVFKGMNYIDSDGVFHQRISRIDMGSMEWSLNTTISSGKSVFESESPSDMDVSTTGYSNRVCYSNKYPSYELGVEKGCCWEDYIYVTDSTYTDAETFKSAMKGVYLYYKLATEITKQADGNEMASSSEEWTFTLSDGTTVTKTVLCK